MRVILSAWYAILLLAALQCLLSRMGVHLPKPPGRGQTFFGAMNALRPSSILEKYVEGVCESSRRMVPKKHPGRRRPNGCVLSAGDPPPAARDAVGATAGDAEDPAGERAAPRGHRAVF